MFYLRRSPFRAANNKKAGIPNRECLLQKKFFLFVRKISSAAAAEIFS